MSVIGQTPLVQLDGIYAKLECCNPCGSIKDRMVDYVLTQSEQRGLLRPGMTIIEATSGNTGIALAWYGRARGYHVTIVMPENMTEERKSIIRALGAELILCSAEGSFAEAAAIRDRIAAGDPARYFNPDQFSNPLNVECHYRTTGQEILRDIRPHAATIDAFVAGVGTGGTLIGIARALREVNPNLHIAAVEPAESDVMSGGRHGPHLIGGIGDGFIPPIAGNGAGGLHELIHEVIRIPSTAALTAARDLATRHGLCVGVSSGANYLAARQLQSRHQTVVTLLPDGFTKYRSLGLRGNPNCPYRRDAVQDQLVALLDCERAAAVEPVTAPATLVPTGRNV